MTKPLSSTAGALLATSAAALLAATPLPAEAAPAAPASTQTFYRTATVDGLKVFYREAGRVDAPTIVLLHGFPTSSHMYRELIPALADTFHVIAPD